MEIALKKKDWRVLYELEKDARQSLQAISKKTGVSKQLLSYMLKKYEKEKIILAYTAIIDSSRLGYYSYRVYMKFAHVTTKKAKEEFYLFLASIPETTIVNSIDMRWDTGFIISVRRIFDFYNVWEKIMSKRELIDEYKIAIYAPVSHFTRTLLSPEPTKEAPEIRVLGAHEAVETEEHDIKLLQELSKNVRESVVEIARRTKLNAQYVSRRIRALEKNGVIQGYRPLINWGLLGYSYYKMDVKLSGTARNKELFSFCHLHPNVIQVNQTIGGSDFEFEVFAKSKAEFKEIMDSFTERFSDVVVNYEYFTVGRPYKETFMAF